MWPLARGVPPPKALTKETAAPGEGSEMLAGSWADLGPGYVISQGKVLERGGRSCARSITNQCLVCNIIAVSISPRHVVSQEFSSHMEKMMSHMLSPYPGRKIR